MQWVIVVLIVLVSNSRKVAGFLQLGSGSPSSSSSLRTRKQPLVRLSNHEKNDETAQERIHRMRSGRLTEEEKHNFLQTTLGSRYNNGGDTSRQLGPAKATTTTAAGAPTTTSRSWTTDNVIATRNSNIPSSQLEKDRIKREWVERILDPDRFAGYAHAKQRTASTTSTPPTDDDEKSSTTNNESPETATSATVDDSTPPSSTTSILLGLPGLRSTRSPSTTTATTESSLFDPNNNNNNNPADPSHLTSSKQVQNHHIPLRRSSSSSNASTLDTQPDPLHPQARHVQQQQQYRDAQPKNIQQSPPPPRTTNDQYLEWRERNYPPPSPNLSIKEAAAEHAAWMDQKLKMDDHIHAIDIIRHRRQQQQQQPPPPPPPMNDDTTTHVPNERPSSRRLPDPHPEWSIEEKSKRWGIDLTRLK